MKKVLLVLVLLVAVFALSATKVEAATIESTESFTVDGVQTFELQHNRPAVNLYYDIVGYYDEAQTKPIKVYVASALDFEIGTTLTVANVSTKDFNYRAVLIDGQLDTSWHNY